MEKEEYLQVGVITSTHGVRGEVKVFPTTDDVSRFQDLEEVLLDTGKRLIPLEIAGVKYFKQYVILKFKGIDSINDVEQYRRMPLLVTREQAVPLDENEYFIADMLGMEVYTEDGTLFGVLKDVMETGANDVYVVESKAHGEVLIPAIQDCILRVDIPANRMTVRLLKGLIQ